MKVAVCVSGLLSGNYINRNNRVLMEKFPTADFYYASWSTQKNKFTQHFPSKECFFFDEPVMHYHPYFIENCTAQYYLETKNWIVKQKKVDWSSHHTKQILIYAWLLDKIKEKNYDVIVRTRFDAFIWKDRVANFTPFVEDSFLNKRANGFAVTKKPSFKTLYESDYINTPKMKHWLLDQLIIHPTFMIDKTEIDSLHEAKQLKPAEHGWHQVLSEKYGNNHRNWHGWVNHDKNIEQRFLDEG
jgi:hypothetical protein